MKLKLRAVLLSVAAMLSPACAILSAAEVARNTCHASAHAKADHAASDLCPVGEVTWDDCEHAPAIEDGLRAELEECDK